MGADVKLLFGASEGSLGQITSDLQDMLSKLDSKPLKIKVGIIPDEASIAAFRAQLADIGNLINGLGTVRVAGVDSGGANKFAEEMANAASAVNTATNAVHSMNASLSATNASKVADALNSINGVSDTGVRNITNSIQEANVAIQRVEAAWRQVAGKEQEIIALRVQGTNEIGQTVNYLIEYNQKTGEISRTTGRIVTEFSNVTNEASGALGVLKEIETVNSSISHSYTRTLSNLMSGDTNSTNTANVEALRQKYIELTNATDVLREKRNTATQEEINNIYRIQTELLNLINSYNNTPSAPKAATPLTNTDTEYYNALRQIDTLLTQVTQNQQKWSAAKNGVSKDSYNDLQKYIDQLTSLKQKLEGGTLTSKDFAKELSNIKSGVKQAEGAIKNAGEATKSWGDRVTSLAKKFTEWFSLTRIVMAIYRTIRKMVTSVIELDTAMTELKKVTDNSNATYKNFLENSTARAKKLGATIKDVVSASADFARLGYGIEDAEKLADAAIVYKNVGDGIEDIGTASESIIATMQAFGVSADEVMSIVDRFNEVGNNYAISSKGVGDALLRSAAALHSANNTLDESIALAAAANTIVQDPEKVGTTLKTVSMYLRAAKTEAEEAGESTDGMANSVSELRDELLSLSGNQVDIMLDDKTFKSTYQILKELSDVWKDLSDVSQANILEIVGGKRNSNVVAALLEDFSIAEEAIATSANSAGSALSENEKVLESVQGHINVMKASFEELSKNFISPDLIKTVTDLMTLLINIANGIVNITNLLGGLKTILYGIISAVLVLKADVLAGGITKLITKLQSLTLIFEKLQKAMLLYKVIHTQSIAMNDTSATVLQKFSLALQGVGISLSSAQIAMIGFVAAIGAISLAVSIAKKHSEKLEEASRKTGEAFTELKSDMEELDKLIKEYNDLQLSNEWNNTPIETKKQLHKDINKLLGEEADKIDILNGKYKETTEELFKQRISKLPEEEKAASDDASSKGETLWSEVYWNKNFTFTDHQDGDVSNKEKEILKKYNDLFDSFTYTSANQGDRTHYNMEFTNFSDFMTKYKEAKKMLQEMYDDGMEDTSLYKELNTFVAKFDDKVEDYENAVKEFDDIEVSQKLSDYIAQNVGGYIDNIEEYSKVVKWVNENFTGADKNSALEFLNSYFSEFADKVDVATGNIKNISTPIENLKNASNNIKILGSAFKELSDDGYITTKTLGEIQTATGLSGDEWEDYKTKLLSAKAGSIGFNQIMSDMTIRILDKTFKINGLVNATEEEIAAVLRENGVLNAQAVARQYLAQTISEEEKTAVKASISKIKSSGLTSKALASEAAMCGVTQNAYLQLYLEEQIFGNSDLKNSEERIKKLMNEAGAVATLKSLYSGLFVEGGASSGNSKGSEIEDYANANNIGIRKKAKNDWEYYDKTLPESERVYYDLLNDDTKLAIAQTRINNKLSNIEIKTPDFSGLSTSSSKDDKPSYEDPIDAIINRINLRDKELKQQESDIENLLEFAKLEKDYNEQFSLTNDLITTRTKRLDELNEANDTFYNAAQHIRDTYDYDEDSWFDSMGNATEAYYAELNKEGITSEEKTLIKEIFDHLSKYKKAYADNAKEITDINKQLLKDKESLGEIITSSYEGTLDSIEFEKDMVLAKNPNTDTTSYYKWLQDEYHKEAEELRSLDPEGNKDRIEELQKLWWDAEEAINNEAAKMFENRVKDIKHKRDLALAKNPNLDVSSYFKQLQDEYHKEAERLRALDPEKYKETIEELQKLWWDAEEGVDGELSKVFENRVKDIEFEKDMALAKDKHTNVSSYYKWLQDIYNKEIEDLKALDPEKFKERIQELQKLVWEAEENIWDENRKEFDARIEDLEYDIQHSIDFGWENGDNEIKARERVLHWIQSDYYRALIKDDEEYYKILEEHRLKHNQAIEDEFNRANDLASTYLDSQKTLLQAHYDVENSIAEARHEINKELETSMTMYEYLDEETRKLLFNQEDYNELWHQLNEIEDKSLRLKQDYEDELNHATLDTIESITSHYQMQYETLMKSYEIAKADLEVAKKKAKLNNVLNERNVRMFINGQWQWVANTEDVANAKSELADAEYARRVAESGLTQQESINNLTKQQDELTVIINKFESGILTLEEAVARARDAIGSIPYAVDSSYTSVTTPTYYPAPSKSSKNNVSSNATATIPGIGEVGVHINSNNKTTTSGLPVGTIVHTTGGDYKITGGTGGNYTSIEIKNKHAKGTRYTPGGFTLLGEKGFEAYINSTGSLIPITRPTVGNIGAGGIVFNEEQLASLRTLWDLSKLGRSNYDFINTSPRSTVDNSNSNNVIINGLTVDTGSSDGQALLNALKRYVGTH